MNTLTYKDYEGSACVDTERQVLHGKILFIDDLVTYESDSPAGLQREFEAAVDDYLETCIQVGKQPNKSYKGVFNVRVSSSTHRDAAVRAVRDGVTLNDVVNSALVRYLDGAQNVNHNFSVTIQQPAHELTVTSTAGSPPTWERLQNVAVRH